mgnify:CR=1 FL=1
MKYYEYVGFPLARKFEVENNLIKYNGKILEVFGEKECVILELLIQNRQEVVSFEEIVKAYWGEEWTYRFSFFSLTKVIQKIRDNLIKAGVPESSLITVRKKGYMVVD